MFHVDNSTLLFYNQVEIHNVGVISMMLSAIPNLLKGDNLEILKGFPTEFVDLAYLDPPFFTGKDQTLFDRTLSDIKGTQLSFRDVWTNHKEYLEWIHLCLQEVRRILKPTGSVFLHCDWHASHLLRIELDKIFHLNQFRGEIIWYYKRWTNTLRTFQRAHQTIYFYSKTDSYKFNPLYEDYSLTTNIDQIWQKRGRDENGKCITVTDEDGDHVPLGEEKFGVPMRDVWEIPYLNPRARERTGWPTQKPLELLRPIILACTDEGDVVLDPVCGSGTTLVVAKALGRQWIGIDSSEEAIEISKRRLASEWNPFDQTNHHTPYRISRFLKLSRAAKIQHIAILLNMNVVQRNANLDGFLKKTFDGLNVAVRYVESDEPIDIISRFAQVAHKKQSEVGIVIMPRATDKEKEHLQELFQKPVKIFVFSYKDICRKTFNVEDIIYDRQITLNLG
jgi:site-specific DNA-methyltransferase (adenine-specific)